MRGDLVGSRAAARLGRSGPCRPDGGTHRVRRQVARAGAPRRALLGSPDHSGSDVARRGPAARSGTARTAGRIRRPASRPPGAARPARRWLIEYENDAGPETASGRGDPRARQRESRIGRKPAAVVAAHDHRLRGRGAGSRRAARPRGVPSGISTTPGRRYGSADGQQRACPARRACRSRRSAAGRGGAAPRVGRTSRRCRGRRRIELGVDAPSGRKGRTAAGSTGPRHGLPR